jgi:predicted SnoaL-like aldol condensation-catalyzing enzyme
MRMSILATLVVFGLASCAEKPVTDIPGEEIMSNQAKVIQLLNSIESGDTKPVEYIHPKTYIQHNLQAADGVEGFGALLEQLDGTGKVRVVRAYKDGDFVFTHSEYDFFGPKVGFDIFRFEDGLIVEHWDNLQDLVSETVSGRSQTDGPKEAVDFENTEMNKALVGNFCPGGPPWRAGGKHNGLHLSGEVSSAQSHGRRWSRGFGCCPCGPGRSGDPL